MKDEKMEILLLSEDSETGIIEAYEKVFSYLLNRCCEGCEEYEGFGVFESINGGTGRKRLFDTGSENRMHK